MAFQRNFEADAKYRAREHRAYRKGLLAQLKSEGWLACTAKVCVMPSREITNPNGNDPDGLHAGHNDAGTAYDGAQHNACNVKDGARRARRKQLTNRGRWIL